MKKKKVPLKVSLTDGMILLLTLLVLCSICLIEGSQDLAINRVQVRANKAKQDSIRIHGCSPELVTLHAILRFSSPINTQHNTLFIDQSSLEKYSKILQEEREEIKIRSRSTVKILSYLSIADNATDQDVNDDGFNDKIYELVQSVRYLGLGGSTGIPYDGVFLMDEFSAIWNEYNVAIFTESLLTFRYRSDGETVSHVEVDEFDGLVYLPCDVTYNSDQCLVAYDEGITATVKETQYLFPTYRVIIDLDSPTNFLPIDLYLLWYAANDHTLTLGLNNNLQLLHLDREAFGYEMHQSNIILLGVDVLYHFPRLEYSIGNAAAIQLWYYRNLLLNHADHEVIKTLFIVFNAALLITLFVWATGYNYLILDYMVEFASLSKITHYYAYKQVLFEVGAILIALIVITISLAIPQTGEPNYHYRKDLFIGFLVYYVVLLIILLYRYREVNHRAFRQYFPRLYKLFIKYCYTRIVRKRRSSILLEPLPPPTKVVVVVDDTLVQRNHCIDTTGGGCPTSETIRLHCDPEIVVLPYGDLFLDICDRKVAERVHEAVVGLYHDPIVKLPTPFTIVSNAAFSGTLFLSLMLLFNFYTALNIQYILLIIALSFGLIYYSVKYITISIFYISLFFQCCRLSACDRKRIRWLTLFIVIQIALTLTYIILSIESLYIYYINTVNSTHSVQAVHTYLYIIIAVVILAPVFVVCTTFDDYVDPLIACALDYRRKVR